MGVKKNKTSHKFKIRPLMNVRLHVIRVSSIVYISEAQPLFVRGEGDHTVHGPIAMVPGRQWNHLFGDHSLASGLCTD